LDFSSLRNSKLEEQKRNFILNLKWKRSIKLKITDYGHPERK
jgi:hypothetical protein